MNYNKLRYFYTVAQTLNFTKAAEQLYISQSAVSRRTAMTHRAVAYAKHARHQRRARRQAGRVRAVVVIKPHALLAQCVQIGRGVAVVAVAAHMIGSERVHVHEKYSHIDYLPSLF